MFIMFARYDLPNQVVSNNGRQFVSKEFNDFMKMNGIKLIKSSPYHPSSIGDLRETLKKLLELV